MNPSLPSDAKRIPGRRGYFATPAGDIYSTRRDRVCKLKPSLVTGALRVTLQLRGGRREQPYVGPLVLMTFKGPKPSRKHICRYVDRDPTNVHASNLVWGTYQQRSDDTMRYGTRPIGERHYAHKLTEPEVLEIIELLRGGGMMKKSIAAEFNVSPETISAIASGRIWKHIPRPERLRKAA